MEVSPPVPSSASPIATLRDIKSYMYPAVGFVLHAMVYLRHSLRHLRHWGLRVPAGAILARRSLQQAAEAIHASNTGLSSAEILTAPEPGIQVHSILGFIRTSPNRRELTLIRDTAQEGFDALDESSGGF